MSALVDHLAVAVIAFAVPLLLVTGAVVTIAFVSVATGSSARRQHCLIVMRRLEEYCARVVRKPRR